jgi:hypothetical protein
MPERRGFSTICAASPADDRVNDDCDNRLVGELLLRPTNQADTAPTHVPESCYQREKVIRFSYSCRREA